MGVATQNPELRKRFSGKPEFVVTFMEYIAEQVREHMAKLGFRTMDEMIGHVEVLDTRKAIDHWKAKGLDISPILALPQNPYGQTLHHSVAQDHDLDAALDQQLIVACAPAIERGEQIDAEFTIRNVNRTVGTMLGNAVTRRHGGEGLPDGTITLRFRGSAGQSFGAFVPRGVTMVLEGDANDFVGKGLSGGRIVVRPDIATRLAAHFRRHWDRRLGRQTVREVSYRSDATCRAWRRHWSRWWGVRCRSRCSRAATTTSA